ncbi:LysR family transcriptional regulator [Amycolatopsis australiensis]|uniref:DNA-binding transcriptional regulator, LysR family n=1 Tax=Amycolatopsis australiensis TaxID=546364 RepID=A0A1K1SA58_9PSEU|nr:LysR family transcriptional regulator [Amycolatopsis australiensis]SFW81098.1 DNA-binding transcriptional regulator, LysR family [Amycolatopsis australiensis]
MPSLDLLSTFLAVYRRGSLSAAAAELGLTQPAVTGQLSRLENELGETLFTRSRHGAAPTARAVELAARIGTRIDELRGALAGDGDAAVPLDRVALGGASDAMAARILPALTPLTTRGLRLSVTLGLADELLAALAAARLDLVVSSVRPRDRALIATPMIDEEFVLVAAPALVRSVDPARLAAEPVAALAHLPLVAYADELPIIRRYWRSEFGRRPPNRVAVVVPDLRAILAAVVAGAGATVLPRYIAAGALEAGSVEPVHEPAVAPLNTWYLVTRTGTPPRPAVTLVRDRLLERAKAWGTV